MVEGIKQSLFRFSDPALMETHFSFNREFQWEEGDGGKIELNTPVSISFSKPNPEDFDRRQSYIHLTAEVGKKGPDFPYYVSATMGADFAWDESLPRETVEAMLSRNAPSLLLGYVRPYIAQITEASPVGAVHIPFMNFAQQK